MALIFFPKLGPAGTPGHCQSVRRAAASLHPWFGGLVLSGDIALLGTCPPEIRRSQTLL
jgi:hypothetical protein